MLQVQDLRKHFGAVAAVNGVSFTAADGTITGVLGENGAGKTTTLASICGLLTPDSGSIQIDGGPRAPGDARRRIGALLDHQGLYPRLTARENIAYFAELQGLPAAAIRPRVDDIVAALDLDRIADRRTAGFSQGERLKVALARAIVHAPRNILLDEPTNGLDIPTVRGLRTLVRQMRDQGLCIVFSSHVLDEVRTLCDHIVVVSRGRVVSQGTADAICARAGAKTLEDAFVMLTERPEVAECVLA